jgi:hypothetical protein
MKKARSKDFYTIKSAVKKKPVRKKKPSKKVARLIKDYDNSKMIVIVRKGDIQKKRFRNSKLAALYNKEHFDDQGETMKLIDALKKGYE